MCQVCTSHTAMWGYDDDSDFVFHFNFWVSQFDWDSYLPFINETSGGIGQYLGL